MYYSAIGLLAILTLLIINWDILRDSRINEKAAWNVYRKFLFAVLAYYITDVLWGILEHYRLDTALFIDTTVYYVAMSIGITFWAEYTVSYLDIKTLFGRVLIIIGRIISLVILGLTIINIFTPVLFTVNKKCVYTPLLARNVMLVSQIIFLLIISSHALSAMFVKKLLTEKVTRHRILASFSLFMAAFLFAQIWFPYLPLYSIAYMIGTCLLHAFVINYEKEDFKNKLESAKKVSELSDRFRSLLDNIPGMTFTKDAKTGKYLACNKVFAEYAHKDTPADVIGLTDSQIFDAETAAHFFKDDKIALSLNTPYVFYEDVPDAMGNKKQLQTTKIKYTDTQGRLCVLGICQDITDLVNIQHEQAMTKEAYENAVNTGLMYNHIAQTLARDYTVMFYVNTDSEEFTEYRRAKADGTLSEKRRGWHFFSDCKKELSENIYPDDREDFLNAMNRKKLMNTLSRKKTFVMTYRYMIKDKPVYVNMKVSRMENDDNYIIIGFTNVDSEMRETIARNKVLTDALSSIEAANKARNEFLSGMSHDLHKPINTIIGINTLALKNNNLDSETKEYFEKIGSSAEHLLSLINNILDMSRLEAGKNVLQNNEFSLNNLIMQLNALTIPDCEEKGLHYECNLINQPDSFYIGDINKLKEVLYNILSNAVKFTESGSVTMTVEKKSEFKDQACLCFTIKDTGIGMDNEKLSHLFDAFSPENMSNRTKVGSSGLSMIITKRLVEMMNGSITVESEKGIGTTFAVMITLNKSDTKKVDHTGEININTIYALVVDDNPIDAEYAKIVLEEAGIQVDTCTSGQEALDKMEIQHARKQPYTIVLMDWNMPGMNGPETSKEIYKLYGRESMVVAMTAYSWDDIREEAEQVGVENYLEKPLIVANITHSLEQIAHQSNMQIFKEKHKARLNGRRILLAEDMEINAELLTDMLEMENVKVDHALNGKIAVKLFENSTAGIYSAILMDVRMPEMDGLEAAKAIRDMDREDAKRIPIIALTANTFDEDVKLSLQSGMNAHLSKPVEADNLIRVLGELIYESEQNLR